MKKSLFLSNLSSIAGQSQKYDCGKRDEPHVPSYSVRENEKKHECRPVRIIGLVAQCPLSGRKFKDFRTEGKARNARLQHMQAQVNF